MYHAEVEGGRMTISNQGDKVLAGCSTAALSKRVAYSRNSNSTCAPNTLRVMEAMLVTFVDYVVATLVAEDRCLVGNASQGQNLSPVFLQDGHQCTVGSLFQKRHGEN